MELSLEEEKKLEEFCAQAFDFARNNEVQYLEVMLDAGLNVNLCNHKGDSLLMLASYHNSFEVAELLLQRGANVDQKNNRNQTPLAGVCFKGYLKMAQLLLKYGANPNDGGNLSPINCAIIFKRNDILPLLLQHTDKKLGFWQKLWMKLLMFKNIKTK